MKPMLLKSSLIVLCGLLTVSRLDAFRAKVNLKSKRIGHGHQTKPAVAFVVDEMFRGGSYAFEPGEGGDEEEELVYEDAKEYLEDEESGNTTAAEQQQQFDDPTADEDSSANVDRMEYADAYDEEEVVEYVDYVEEEVVEEEEVPAAAETTQENVVEQVAMAQGVDEDGNPFIQLATVITPEMRSVLLKELNYQASDLKNMRPEIASILVAKRLGRPLEGLPDSWYTQGDEASGNSSVKSAAIKITFCLAVCAAQVALGGKTSEFSIVALLGPIADRLPFLSKAAPPKKSPPPKRISPAPAEKPVEEPAKKKEEESGGVRPGGAPSSSRDEAWLDRRITAAAKAIDDFIDFLFRKR